MRKVRNLSKKQGEGYAPFAPDFVIELRSPSDRLTDLQAKMEEWIANGVELGWLIDPQERQVLVYREGCQPELHYDISSIQGDGCVAGFELIMERIWGRSNS